jgi:SAM-dependent methyltransferase
MADAEAPEADGHVMAGSLVCQAGCRYSIKDGVPILVTEAVDDRSAETARRFDLQWTRWRGLADFYERQLLDWIAPLTKEDFVGRLVLEGGCGKGRHTKVVAGFGPRALVSMDLGASAFIAFGHTRALPNAHVVMADLTRPPVRAAFDLAFSVGVLHHLPDPRAGWRALASRLHPGGRIVAWLYGYENNEWIVRFVDPIRKALTASMAPEALRVVSAAPSLAMWAAVTAYPRLPDGLRARLPYAGYFRSLAGFPFAEIHNIVFDQLVTPVAHYLKGDEVRSWLASGFRDVEVRWKGEYSWTAVGTVV